MARVSAQEFAEKWSRRTKAAVEDYKRGVGRVTEPPGRAAARAVDKLVQNLMASLQSGEWERAVSGVTLQDWQAAASGKGAGRIAAGVDGASSAMGEVAGKLLAHIDAGLTKIASMPNLSLEDSIARQAAWTRHMAGFKS